MGYTFYKPISEEQLRLGSEFARVDSDIALEKSERIASDTAIVNALHDESTLRAYNDDSIIGLLNNETLTRHNSDTLLAKNLADEVTLRSYEDAKLQTSLAAEQSARTTADSNLQTSLASEQSARTTADSNLQTSLASEQSARTTADSNLQNSLAAEQSARYNADALLTANKLDATANAVSATKLLNARTFKVSLDSDNTPSFNGTSAVTIGTSGILPVAKGGTSTNNLNNITVGGANRDGSGNVISSYYMPKSGGSFTGAINTANNTWNSIGDDVAIGDHNVVGGFGILGLNGNTRLDFCKYGSPATYKSITYDGTNLHIDGTSNNVTGIVAVANGGTGSNNLNNITVGGANRDGAGNNIVNTYVKKDGSKVLSTNDYTTAEKNKLANIADSAQVNVIESVKVNNSALTITNKSVNIDLANASVKSAAGLNSAKNLKVSLNNPNAQAFDGSGDCTVIGVSGTLPTAYGGTGSNNLNNITVGGANRDGAGNNISQTYLPTVTAANTYLSKTEAATIYISKTESANASNADKLSTARNFKVSLNSDNFPNFDGSANVTIGTSGILPVAKGGTNATDLNNITVGGANRDGSGNVISSYYMPKSGGTFTGNLTAPRFNGLGAHYYGTCSTDPDDSNKIVTCPGFVLTTGVIITVNFSKINRASTVFLNVNGTGNIQVITSLASTRRDDFFELNSVPNSFSFTTISNSTPATFVYNGTYWFLSPESHAVSEIQNGIVKYANLIGLDYLQLGQANCDVYYGYCTTAASTAAKVVYCPEITSDTMTTAADFYLFVKFDNTNSATNITFNVNSTGAYSVVGFHDISTHINSLYFRTNNVYVFKWKAALQKFVLTRAFHYLPKPSWYITCSTDAATAAKVNDDSTSVRAYCNRDANRITLNLINTNTASNPTLNINRTGIKPIYYGANRLTGKALKAGIYDLIYDSTAGYYRVLSMPFTSLGTDSVASEGAMWISWN